MHHNFGGGGGGVGEFVLHRHITGGVDTRIGGLHMVIDNDAAPAIGFDAHRLQPQTFNVGNTTGSDQNLIDD